MRQVVLLGSPGTKRQIWLEKAADQAGVPISFLDWKKYEGDWRETLARNFPDWERCGGGGSQTWNQISDQKRERAAGGLFIKIDPPVWDSCCLEELDGLTRQYERDLKSLASLAEEERICFLNHPLAIGSLLDKRECKKRLIRGGIPVTETLTEKAGSLEELLEAMERDHISQVFIKPVRGSGAAGASAFRYQRKTGHMVLYTCGLEDPATGRLVNTKRLRRFEDRDQIRSFLDSLLKTDCMAERWYAKAEHHGYSYDLRAVVQEDKADFILARLSKGPITNLHLNNHPLKASELGLGEQVTDQVEELCRQAAGCFDGLGTVGLDILLEKGSLKPRVIEMNGQGDLIYQDIYHENKIYRHQAEMMKEWMYGEKGRSGGALSPVFQGGGKEKIRY